ncbi:MAG: DUF4139 domain-containing protein [Alphaproteobacteria bacterium]|nr:MAG: DUF4139 domain-containing protein [Alphaproteobacteria bacterium]
MAALSTPPAHAAEDATSTAAARRDLAVTIYNENLALVRDAREVTLDKGERRLAFADVSAQIRPETAALKADGLRVLEQNFDFDLLTPAALLEKAVGETVRLYRRHPTTGIDSVESATVLSAAGGGVVLKIGDRIEVMQDSHFPGRIVFDKIPPNLRARPTLSMTLNVAKAGTRSVELAYLTRGLSWKADYVGVLDAAETTLALTGLVTLTNRAGVAFADALVQLVAGDVNQVRQADIRFEAAPRGVAAMAAPPVAEEALGDYHLYTLARRTTIADNQTKQVTFLTAPKVKTAKTYRYRAHGFATDEQARSVAVEYRFDNRAQAGLGLALPRGVVRVYASDKAGRAQFVGEDAIAHTAKNETVVLTLGRAFDVKARGRTVTDDLIARSRDSETREITQAYVLTNAKDQPVTVLLDQTMWGDWQILSSSVAAEKADARTARFAVSVPAEGETTLDFTVRTRR